MAEPWEAEDSEECWADREAWRGELHAEAAGPWHADTGEGFVWAGEDEAAESGEPEDAPGWPVNLAGPEYWMYRRMDG